MAVVANVASLGRSGLKDFVLQRISAVVLGAYALCVLGFAATAPEMSHQALADYFRAPVMRLFTTLAIAALAAHGWIGMWTVGTDYIRRHYFGSGHTVCLALYQLLCLGAVFVYAVWPLSVVWGS